MECLSQQDGTVQDLIERMFVRGAHIPEMDIMHMFRSLCEAIEAFHSSNPPLAHRDIKVGLAGGDSGCGQFFTRSWTSCLDRQIFLDGQLS